MKGYQDNGCDRFSNFVLKVVYSTLDYFLFNHSAHPDYAASIITRVVDQLKRSWAFKPSLKDASSVSVLVLSYLKQEYELDFFTLLRMEDRRATSALIHSLQTCIQAWLRHHIQKKCKNWKNLRNRVLITASALGIAVVTIASLILSWTAAPLIMTFGVIGLSLILTMQGH